MIYNKLNSKDIKSIFTNNNFKEEYVDLYNTYREILTEYLITKLDIKKYDEKIKKSKLRFIKCDESDMDVYQYFSSPKLNYFYIRNNIFIERLKKSQIEFLAKISKNNEITMTDEISNFVKNTYQEIIKEDVGNSNNKEYVLFGPDNKKFFALNTSIVIGLRYDEFNSDGISDDEWFEITKKRKKYLYEIMEKIEENAKKSNFNNGEVKVILYSDTSVIVRK